MHGVVTVVALGSCLCIHPAFAHHSVAAEFDPGLQGELEGEITQVWYTNPHIRYRLEVASDTGEREAWELQAGNVTTLRRADWFEDTLQVGDRITVYGDLGRRGAKKLRIEEVVLADGRKISPRRENVQEERSTIRASATRNYGYTSAGNDYPIDITGPWRNDYRWRVTVDDLEPKPTPFTPEGRRLFDSTEPWHDDALRCVALGLPRVFGSPYNMDIVDAGSHYLMVYVEHNMPRRIWMDGRSAPPNMPATSMGFSLGRWEGEDLVIETSHLRPGWLDGSGLPMAGEDTRIVERYEFSQDRLSIERTMTIYDPYYTEPVVRRRASARGDSVDITEQAACDPDSYYRDLDASGRLQEHFQR